MAEGIDTQNEPRNLDDYDQMEGSKELNALLGVPQDEPEAVPAVEPEVAEETEPEKVEEAEEAEGEAEAAEKVEPETDEEVDEPTPDLKALLGRVPSLQSKADKTDAKVSKLESALERLNQLLQPKQEQEAEGLIDQLTSDDGEQKLEAFVDRFIQKKYGATISQLEAQNQGTQYYQQLQDLSGADFPRIESAAQKVFSQLVENARENPAYAPVLEDVKRSPLMLKLLAEKYLSTTVSSRAQAQKEARQEKADKAGNISKDTKNTQSGLSEKDIMSLKNGEAEKFIKNNKELREALGGLL